MKRVDQFRFRILDNSPEGVILLDADLKIVYLNKMIEDWTGFTLEDIEDKPIIDVFPHMAKPAYKNRLKQVMQNRFPMILSSQLHPGFIPTDPNRSPRIGQTTISSVEETDTSAGMLRISLMDMTASTAQYHKILELQKISKNEIKKREAAQKTLLNERAELQEANAAKDKFFSILAHDLRGPLGGLMTMSETMLDDFDLFEKDDLKDIIRIMHHSSSQVFGLLENLLTWSRLNTGRIDFNPAIIRMKPIINDIVNLYAAQVTKKELKLELICSERMMCYADQDMVETLIRNLLSNALKFTARGGEIRLSCRGDGSSGDTLIEITDSGVGMAPEILEKVFDISSKYHTPGTENEASSGLGLVLVKEFVERNAGTLEVNSELGVGSTFRCYLPARPTQ